MSYLGKNLQKTYKSFKKKSLQLILEIAVQCLERINSLHESCYLHRDIKPSQFLIDDDFLVYLIDFGLSKAYMNGKLMIHIPYGTDRPFIGTLNYASLNTHFGIQQSRRDDLESFCYMLSYMINEKLPWSNDKNSIYTAKDIKRLKSTVVANDLFKSLPLIQMFNYVKQLYFEQPPDYTHINNLLMAALKEIKTAVSTVGTLEITNTAKSGKTRKGRKKTKKNKKTRLFKSCYNLTLEFEGNSITEVTNDLPEFKNRNILKDIPVEYVENLIVQEKSFCFIM